MVVSGVVDMWGPDMCHLLLKSKLQISHKFPINVPHGRCTLNKDDQIRLLVTLFTVRSVLADDTKVHPNMIQNACCLRSELQKQTCILSLICIA